MILNTKEYSFTAEVKTSNSFIEKKNFKLFQSIDLLK